jgi:hypothetical protein
MGAGYVIFVGRVGDLRDDAVMRGVVRRRLAMSRRLSAASSGPIGAGADAS